MKIQIPKHLSREAKAFYRQVVSEFCLDDNASLRILQTACEALDLMKECKATIELQGLTVQDKALQIKAHPLLPTLRDSRSQFLQALKQLNLDLMPQRDMPGRPAVYEGGIV